MSEGQIIIHVDMDAFYAYVEMRDNKTLIGKPLIIGSMPNERGVVSTCNYEARKYGIRSGMNIKEAFNRCPKGVFMHPNFDKYIRVSNQLHEILESYTDMAEYIALDEGYLDLTGKVNSWEEARKIGHEIKKRVREELSLTCSVGLAYSKTAAKTASEEKKPDGYFEIPSREDFVTLVLDRNVKSLYTVGEKTAKKLHLYGVDTVSDLQNKSNEVKMFMGKQGEYLVDLAFGYDDRKVTPYREEDTKSISKEFTFQKDVSSFKLLDDVLFILSFRVAKRAKRLGLYGEGVSVKITYSNMKSITRSMLISASTNDAYTIYENASKLLKNVSKGEVRLVGTGLYHLREEDGRQLSFADFFSTQKDMIKEKIESRWQEMSMYYKIDFDEIKDMQNSIKVYDYIERMREVMDSIQKYNS
jgi:DNA polymerase IV